MSTHGSRARKLTKVAATALAVLSVGVAVVGVGHMPWARPLLQRLGGCPAGRVTPAQVEAAQRRAWRTLRGAGRAPARPALGFELERTTLADLRAWAGRRGLACEVERGGALLRCGRVPASALAAGTAGVYDDVSFGFRLGDQRLVNVTTLRTGLATFEVAAQLRDATDRLERALGAPTQRSASESPSFVLYRYADYLAGVAAMELPGRGHAVREHYLSALD